MPNIFSCVCAAVLQKEIERAPRKFNKLRIPTALERELPFVNRPKEKVKVSFIIFIRLYVLF